jgi:hypothetical protein
MTYVLIIAVAAVWGVIFYQIFKSISDEDEIAIKSTIKASKPVDLQDYTRIDTGKLNLNYPDPFYRDIHHPSPVIVAQKDNTRSIQTITSFQQEYHQNPKEKIENFVTYQGFIINPNTKQYISIINFKGREVMLPEGAIYEGMKLLRNLKDSIKISYQKEVTYIKLN